MSSVDIDYNFFKDKSKQLSDSLQPSEKSRFLCEECKDILIRPHQTECGSRYCKDCVEEWKRKCIKYCPSCKKEIKSLKTYIIQDRALEKEIWRTKIKCINKNCEDIILLKDLQHHLKNCGYREEECNKCHDFYLYLEKNNHKQICRKELVTCEDCKKEILREEMENVHKNITNENLNNLCENLSGECPFECGNKRFESIKSHLQKCVKRPMPCLLRDIGCQKLVNKDSMEDHVKNDSFEHFRLMIDHLKRSQSELLETNNQIINNQKTLESHVCEIKETTKKMTELLAEKSKELMKMKNEIHNFTLQVETDLKTLKTDGLSNNSVCRPSKNHVPLNGDVFTWTVTNIVDKIRNAKRGNETQLMSDAFYTNIPGYKMRIKVYPDGDGTAKGQYLSVYFVIVKGEYDDLISWPFNRKLTLSFVQNDRSIPSSMITMRPDKNEACYGKPTSEFNTAAGQPRFAKLDDLLNVYKYVYDGNLKIRIHVE